MALRIASRPARWAHDSAELVAWEPVKIPEPVLSVDTKEWRAAYKGGTFPHEDDTVHATEIGKVLTEYGVSEIVVTRCGNSGGGVPAPESEITCGVCVRVLKTDKYRSQGGVA